MSKTKKYGLDLRSCVDEASIFEFECSCGRKGELIISKEISKAISRGGTITIREREEQATNKGGMQMCIPSDDWISPEAAPKLIKLLQKSKGFNYYKKVSGVYYFNGESFHKDEESFYEDVLYLDGKITGIKVTTSNKKVVDHDFDFTVHMAQVRFEDPKPVFLMCKCGKKIDRRKYHWVVNGEAMCDKCYKTKWCAPYKPDKIKVRKQEKINV